MELKVHETALDYLKRTVYEPIYQELTAEAVVPESMPDMERVLDAYGTVILQNKQLEGGEARLSGGVQAGVLYVPEGGGAVQKLELWLPFSLHRKAEDGGCLVEQSWLRSIDARMVNARKAVVRANLGVQLTQYHPEEFRLAQVDAEGTRLQLKTNKYPALLPVDCAEQEFRIQDELQIPETGPAIDRILKWDMHPTVEDSRVIGNKAVFKGDIVVEMLYLGTDDSINTWVGQIPYSQYAELSADRPDAAVAVFPVITSAQLESDGQMESRTVLADLSLLAQVCLFDRVELELTEDAYAVGAKLEPAWQEVALQPQLDRQTLKTAGELTLPGVSGTAVSVSLYPDRPAIRRGKDGVVATSAISGCLLLRDGEGRLVSKPIRGEVSCSAACCDTCSCTADCRLADQPTANAQAGGFRIGVPMEFSLETYQQSAWKNLCGGTLEEETDAENRPSVVIRHVHGGDLWSLAKQLGATVEGIREANAITGDLVPEGELLLIPLR